MIISIDLDGTLCDERPTFSRSLARVLPGAREAVDQLKSEGHRVILYTGRSWSEYEMTKAWLDENHIQHDELIMGKPIVDCFIDDRAVRFSTWPEVLNMLPMKRAQEDLLSEGNLKLIREGAADFLRTVCVAEGLVPPVLDVGPMWIGSPVFRRYPDLFVDAGAILKARNIEYTTLDIDPETHPSFVGDFTDGCSILPKNHFGAVILNHCIEHMPRLFDVPKVLDHCLKSGGRAFIATPWNFRFHGPRPDCWRISDDGYNALFSFMPSLRVVSIEKVTNGYQPLHPVALHCIVEKL
jgi:hypothetical protein